MVGNAEFFTVGADLVVFFHPRNDSDVVSAVDGAVAMVGFQHVRKFHNSLQNDFDNQALSKSKLSQSSADKNFEFGQVD